MKFTTVERHEYEYVSPYDVLYKALVDAHLKDQSIMIDLEGKHRGTVLLALRKRHAATPDPRIPRNLRVGSMREGDNHLLVQFEREWGQ